ncbi:cell wall protein DAN4-like [Daphnia pulex]|uniref:cell wall protein DAN4-like n=1 Tax=Daphnia pulex TaxID=6669 RepID=UPI001EDDB67F|nr:cell wall protein DAN4-like [Daphnia pulex]XP_046456622.1 cell wall protein DAN4-like [Daphnia pulex]XP_046456623.1 cell wall protein DAN4-like [Daphnia pulex]
MLLSSRVVALLFFIVGLRAEWFSEVDDRMKQFNASGSPAVGGEFPYMSLLLLNGDLCEGTLVGPSHILTAAQCVFGFSTTDATDFQVLLNTLTTDGDAGVVNVGVTNFIIHENFDPITMDNDVALLVLQSSVTDVPTVTLPDIPQPITTEPTTIPTTTTKTTTTKMPTTTTTTTTKMPTTTTRMPTTTKTTTTTKMPTTTKTTTTTKMPTTTKTTTTTKRPITTKTTTKTTTKPKPTTTTKTTTKPTTKTTTKTTTKPTTKTTTKKPTTKPTTKRTTTKKKTRFLESISDIVRSDDLLNGKITNRASSSYADSPAVIIGWGTTIYPGGTLSNTLLKADVIVEDNEICASQYADFVGDNMLCATFTGSVNPPTENPIITTKVPIITTKDPITTTVVPTTTSGNPRPPSTANPLCSPALSDWATELVSLGYLFNRTAGRVHKRANTCEQGLDIGGPLFVDGVQVGINSFGYNVDCADPNYTGLYTRVTAYLEWIATTMANNM